MKTGRMHITVLVMAAVLLFGAPGNLVPTAWGQGSVNDEVFGRQLMTEQEVLQFREKMWNARTAKEREQIRLGHHQQMLIRAKEAGVTLPDTPPEMRMHKGMGQGPRDGKGMGQGRGMGGR